MKDGKPIGAKQRAKYEMKVAKKQAREQAIAARADDKKREETRRALEDEERAAEAAREAEAAAKEAARLELIRQKEEEEYQRMKAEFAVEESGTVADEDSLESQTLLQEFVDFIKVGCFHDLVIWDGCSLFL